MILHGDSHAGLRVLADCSIDSVVTDPPYGYSFMGKDWDKAVPSVEIWKECLRVLKPGAFCMVMSAPRSDVQNAMISRLIEAGFRLDFTPIYWTYASGFPKAGNIGKLVDKRHGALRTGTLRSDGSGAGEIRTTSNRKRQLETVYETGEPVTNEAKSLDGSYAGFQPKPAVEVIIVAMKPLSEKTYINQALKNGHGVTWLDDARIPTSETVGTTCNQRNESGECVGHPEANTSLGGGIMKHGRKTNPSGRFPANLLVSDDVLREHSRYFDLDKWADTLPFLVVSKASKNEKNRGLDDFELKAKAPDYRKTTGNPMIDRIHGLSPKKNHHPTVKPLKLMSYLITLTTRKGDTVLDPFMGSGTTLVAVMQLGRKGIGIEREQEYVDIARARIAAPTPTVLDNSNNSNKEM